MNEIRKIIEAVLFASAKPLHLEKISKLCRKPREEVLKTLQEWKKDLETREGPRKLIQDGDMWRLTVHEKYLSVVRKVVGKAELQKSLLETLAIVAYKSPIKQSDVIKMRTNKAYDHLSQLEEQNFITREKYGRTKLIRLAPKFFEYFDLDPAQLKGKFKRVEHLEKQAKKLETYDTLEPIPRREPVFTSGVEIIEQKLGELDVVDVPPTREEVKHEIEEAVSEAQALTEATHLEEQVRKPKRTKQGKGMFSKGVPPEVQEKVDKRIKELMNGEYEE